jgi:hypothetical protein
VVTKTPPSEPPPRARFKSRLHLRAWLASTPERRRPQIRGFRVGGSLAVANSTPATQLLSPAKMLKLNHAPPRRGSKRGNADNCSRGLTSASSTRLSSRLD